MKREGWGDNGRDAACLFMIGMLTLAAAGGVLRIAEVVSAVLS